MGNPSSRGGALRAVSLLLALGVAGLGVALSPVAAIELEPGLVAAADARHTAPSTAEELAANTEAYRQHLTLLANPFFEGRAPGTKGNRIAAEYIEFQYKRLGLIPAFPAETTGDDGLVKKTERASYRQDFAVRSAPRNIESVKLTAQIASYAAGGATVELTPGKDFNTIGASGSGEVAGPLVFCGYSIVNGEKEYSSYPEGTDLTGKVVMVMRFEPMNDEGKSRWADLRWSFAAGLDPKFRRAVEHHAAGIILVSAPGADDDRVNKLEDLSLSSGRPLDVPIIMMSLEAADALVRAGDKDGRSLLDLRKLADEKGEPVDLSGAKVNIKTQIERIPLLTDNVGAILPGKGAIADEFIVVGSHYDHVGYGFIGSRPENQGKLHPGADDNGSGTSGNLLVAERLTEVYKSLPDDANARSILFLAFSAEESGLEGSAFYVKNPIVPAEKHALMLNMDMIGRLRDGKIEIGGVGSAVGLEEWAKPYWDESGMKVKAMKRGPSNSDHASFFRSKIPVLFFFTGLHSEYHTPKDVINTINFEGGAQVADLVYRVALDAALRPEPFEFSDGSASDTSDDQQNNAGPVAGGGGVRFGIMPGDYSGEIKGVLIGEAFEGLPAAKAGLKAGDLITKWNDTPLDSVDSWMPLLGQAKPGDKVVITFIRDKETHTTEVTLIARGGQRN